MDFTGRPAQLMLIALVARRYYSKANRRLRLPSLV
jgi:hypothetical protein